MVKPSREVWSSSGVADEREMCEMMETLRMKIPHHASILSASKLDIFNYADEM